VVLLLKGKRGRGKGEEKGEKRVWKGKEK